MTPAERQLTVANKHYPGTMRIATMHNDAYEKWVPLWRYCIKKAYPQYESFCIAYNDASGYKSAALRFCHPSMDGILSKYDYSIITDVDILIYRENPNIVDQHCRSMELQGNPIYDNWTFDGDRCQGVHFVSKEWWPRTRKVREKYYDHLQKFEVGEGFDERMLLDIIRQCGLPEPDREPQTWCMHGIHIGKYRKYPKLQLEAKESTFLAELRDDKEFNKMLSEPGAPSLYWLYQKLSDGG
jgi:hypothetical protein